tara:strand:+ start:1083 stop:1277 length:195 start_codon:yes stop_codon:yes gene_type:complete
MIIIIKIKQNLLATRETKVIEKLFFIVIWVISFASLFLIILAVLYSTNQFDTFFERLMALQGIA